MSAQVCFEDHFVEGREEKGAEGREEEDAEGQEEEDVVNNRLFRR